jgi:hypothetical protein
VNRLRLLALTTGLAVLLPAGCTDTPTEPPPANVSPPVAEAVSAGSGSLLGGIEVWAVADAPYPVSEEGPRLGTHPTEPWDVVVYESGSGDGNRDVYYRSFDALGPVGEPVPVVTNSPDLNSDDFRWPDVAGDLVVVTGRVSSCDPCGYFLVHRISTQETQTVSGSLVMGRGAVGGPWLAWEDGMSGRSAVRLFNEGWLGTSSTPIVISDPEEPSGEPDVSESFLVWSAETGVAEGDIRALSLTEYSLRLVTETHDSDDRNPATDGEWVVWEARWVDPARDSDLGAYNFVTDETFYFGTYGNDARPRVSGSLVVFEADVGGGPDIMLYDLASGTGHRLTDDLSADHRQPDIHGSTIAWVSQAADGTGDVLLGRIGALPPSPAAQPVVTNLVLPDAPVAVGTETWVLAEFEDQDVFHTGHTAVFDWGDGTVEEAHARSGNRFAASHSYLETGVYTVTVTVSSGDLSDTKSSAETSTPYIAVYDAAGGFATGAGWFHSKVGDCVAENWSGCGVDSQGKALFGFVSRYQRGATTPDGRMMFKFTAGGLDFTGTDYDWLVVTGGNAAHLKGTGALRGSDVEYRFMIWAGDGPPDTIRIKIWREEGDEELVVYDNGSGEPIGGGAITIHN